MDFGELKNDTNFIATNAKISEALDKIDEHLKTVVEYKEYDKLSTEDKVKFDLDIAFQINSLFWMYLKLQGQDPNEHGIKNELSRVKEAMLKNKQIIESKTLRPVLDKEAAKRFIQHGLHDRSDRQKKAHDGSRKTRTSDDEMPPTPKNKKIRFEDED